MAVFQIGSIVKSILAHPKSTKSVINLAYAAGTQLELGDRGLGNIRHPFFDSSLAYQRSKNTALIKNIIQSESNSDQPFFVVSNYMDTHQPYSPPADIQRSRLGEEKNWKQIKELNNELGAWQFASRVDGNGVDENKLQLLRDLYYGEVKAVDNEIQNIVKSLKEQAILDETTIILTADHGENLGESDQRGRRIIGHVSSLSKHLTRVPLIIVDPDTSSDTIDHPVSIKDIATAIINDGFYDSDGSVDPAQLSPENGFILSESPAKGGKETLIDNHPSVPLNVIEEEASEDNILGISNDWRAVMKSNNKSWAWKGGEKTDISSMPPRLKEGMEQGVKDFSNNDRSEQLNDDAIARLEDLGYV